ncbi:hypothetical protein ACHHYP_08012 [Achlya hypogyna]|uniref:Uncharacterized protein n=1 Tax=Achlya hypogyna TaxID=1202772 RepID=A0A1V9YQA9_ACHHY|nr:hypothetical protein ACHHYP_08012 [Achlya hypogyna]
MLLLHQYFSVLNEHVTLSSMQDQRMPQPALRYAYMLYATDDIQACNALLMAKSIRRLGTPQTIDIVVLTTPNVPAATTDALAAGGVVVAPVQPWVQANAPHDTWSKSLTKLRIFEERGYNRVIYLDSDSMLQRNLDHLFALNEAVFWAPRAYYQDNQPFVASTLLVLSPSNALFAQLEAAIAAHPKEEWYDMDVLNLHWRDLYGMLPSHYVILNAHLNTNRTFGFATPEERLNKTYVHHFSSMPNGKYGKPWTFGRHHVEKNPEWHPMFYELFDQYWTAHDQHCTWQR